MPLERLGMFSYSKKNPRAFLVVLWLRLLRRLLLRVLFIFWLLLLPLSTILLHDYSIMTILVYYHPYYLN